MTGSERLLVEARLAAGLGQEQLAQRAGTSRLTMSSYEDGHRSPSLRTASRILAAAGFELSTEPVITFTEWPMGRGRTTAVPSSLPRLPPSKSLAVISLPLHLNWSGPEHQFAMHNRAERARVYEIVLREGGPEEISTYIDGLLLVELWDELVLPPAVRSVWAPIIGQAMAAAA